MSEPINLGRSPEERVRANLPSWIRDSLSSEQLAETQMRPHVIQVGQPAPGMKEDHLDYSTYGLYDNRADALDAVAAINADPNEFGFLTGSIAFAQPVLALPQRGRRHWVPSEDFLAEDDWS